MQRFINILNIATNILLLLGAVYLTAELRKIESRVEYIEAEQIAAQTLFFRED